MKRIAMIRMLIVEQATLLTDEQCGITISVVPKEGEPLVLNLDEITIVRSALSRILLDFGEGAEPQYVLVWDNSLLPGETEGGGVITPFGI